MIVKCKCGRNKARRAFACVTCWDALTREQQRAVLSVGRNKGKGTLRAGKEAKV